MTDLLIASSPLVADPDILRLIADWLHLDVANGDACADTLKTYRGQFEAWLFWCERNTIHPGRATVEDVKSWRQDE